MSVSFPIYINLEAGIFELIKFDTLCEHLKLPSYISSIYHLLQKQLMTYSINSVANSNNYLKADKHFQS